MFRSPIAKALYNAGAKNGSRAESCGIWVQREGHEGVALFEMNGLETSISYMQKKGIDISQEKGVQITKEIVDRAEKVFVMAEEEIWPDYLKNNAKVVPWDVPNPDVIYAKDAERVGEQIAALIKTI